MSLCSMADLPINVFHNQYLIISVKPQEIDYCYHKYVNGLCNCLRVIWIFELVPELIITNQADLQELQGIINQAQIMANASWDTDSHQLSSAMQLRTKLNRMLQC